MDRRASRRWRTRLAWAGVPGLRRHRSTLDVWPTVTWILSSSTIHRLFRNSPAGHHQPPGRLLSARAPALRRRYESSHLPWMMVVTLTGMFRPDVSVAGPPDPARAACRDCDEVISRVLLLLPERPDALLLIDADRSSPALRQAIENAEGFVTVGRRTVCLKKQGFIFQHALKHRGIWDYALACVVWHEMAHVAGADEREAQHAEEELWTQFISSRKVDAGPGLRYLQVLRKRHPEETR